MPYRDASGLAAERAETIGLTFIGPYLGAMTKTRYHCKVHGEFQQTPNKVQQRLGCQKCGRIQQGVTRKLAPERLAEDAQKVGLAFVGGFVTTQVDADYRCDVHGSIRMRPMVVARGSGCWQCGRVSTGLKRRKPKQPRVFLRQPKVSVEQLTAQAAAVGLRYADGYVPSHKIAKYVCEAHGEIEMRPSVVRRGCGCRFCANNVVKTDEQLQLEAAAIGLRYIGPYTNDRTATAYECPKHGVIRKSPGDVKTGRVCRYCARYGFDPAAPAVFYVYRVERITEPSFIGYGLTKDHETRHAAHMATFRTANASAALLATFDLASGREAADLELHLRAVLRDAHITTDLRGFRTEAVAVEAEHEVLSTIAEWLSARNAEVRSAA